jgi:plasmid stabilization system protein ParE
VRVVWAPSALQEIISIYNYVAQRDPSAASDLIEGGRSATICGRLTIVYPYLIRYEIVGNDVTILRIRHGKRRP